MKCSLCFGSGFISTSRYGRRKCSDCNGTGDIVGVQPLQSSLSGGQIIHLQQQADLWAQYIQKFTGISDFMMGGPMKPWKNYHEEDPDQQLKKEMSRVLLDIAGESFFPSTQLYQLANALLIENGSEFLLGVVDEEKHFKEEWEVSGMGRNWGGIDQEVAKIWIDENKGIICARFPYKEKVIAEIRAKVPKGKKSWNPDGKIWEFSVETVDVVVKILTENFNNVVDLTRPETPMLTSQNGGDPLLSLLDEDDINKIYKMLARKYHPDMGGEGTLMAKINQLFSKVREKK